MTKFCNIKSRKDLLENKPEDTIPKTQVRNFSPEHRAVLETIKNSLGNTAKIRGLFTGFYKTLYDVPSICQGKKKHRVYSNEMGVYA